MPQTSGPFFIDGNTVASLQLPDKANAEDLVSLVFGDLNESELFLNWQHPNAELRQRIKWACVLANKIGSANEQAKTAAEHECSAA